MNKLIFAVSLLIPLYAQAAAPSEQISIGDARVVEGNSGTTDLLFNVQREGGSDLTSNVVIPYTVSPSGTHPATPGVDYIAPPTNATLKIPAGQSAQTLHVPVIGDTTYEPNETLQVQLGKAVASIPGVNFLTPPNYPAGNTATSVASGDFNGDGYPDLVVTNESSHSPSPNLNSVSILLGNSAGGFAAPVEYPLLGSATTAAVAGTVAVADFNGDGKLDLAVALSEAGNSNGVGYQVAILLGDGAGGFAAPVYYGNGSTNPGAYGIQSGASVFAFSIVAADFNGDGKLDLAVSNGGILILLGDGRGGFTVKGQYFAEALSPGEPAYALAVGDFNGDGHLDVAATNIGSVNISILLGDGTGRLAPAVNYGGGTSPSNNGAGEAIAAGDFDGDRKLDLAVASPAANTVSIFRGNGAGGFATPTVTFPVGSDPAAIVARDFDGDGKLDLAVANFMSNDVSVLHGDGAGSFTPTGGYNLSGSPFCMIAADFNRDGHFDLAVGGIGVSTLLADGNGSFVGTGSYTVGSNPLSLAIIADAGGRPDLLTANGKGTNLSVLPNLSGGHFGTATNLTLPGNPTSVAIADLDGDGQPDIAVTERVGGGIGYENLLVLLSGGGPTTAYQLDSKTAGAPTSVAAGDLTGDGHPDLVVTNVDPSNTISILVNNGSGQFSLKTNAAVQGSTPMSVILRDFNGDGLLDIATANKGSNDVSIQLGLGDAGFTAATTYSVGTNPTSVTAGDFDENGDLDLAVANFGDNTVSILRNNGDGTFTPAGSILVGKQPSAVTAADFDGDGHIDLAVANGALGENSISILLGDGAGGFAAPVNFAVGVVPISIVATDVDGDGDLDLAVANQGSNTVSILFNESAQGQPVFVNGGTATGTIIDDDPRPLNFQSKTDVDSEVFVGSDSQTVSKLSGGSAPISISGSNALYRINGGAYTSAPGTINNGDKVNLKILSATLKDQTVSAVLTVGSQTASWSVTTGTDTTPSDLKSTHYEVTASSLHTSAPRTLKGVSVPVSISIGGDPTAAYQINGGAFTNATGTINPGDTVSVHVMSAPSGQSVTVNLTIGSGSASDVVTSS